MYSLGVCVNSETEPAVNQAMSLIWHKEKRQETHTSHFN